MSVLDYIFIVFLVLGISILEIRKRRPYTRKGYKSTVSSWTNKDWCVRSAMALYDNLGVRFSIEDEEPWFKKMVIRKDRKTVEEFPANDFLGHMDEFEDKIRKIMKHGMPSIGCPPFSSVRELEMKLELSGVRKLDKYGK